MFNCQWDMSNQCRNKSVTLLSNVILCCAPDKCVTTSFKNTQSSHSTSGFTRGHFPKPISRQCFTVFSNTQPSSFCALLTYSCCLKGPLSLLHMEQCSALKFICFSSGEQTFSNCLCQSRPCWNPKRLPDWPSSAPVPLQLQRTEDSGFPHKTVAAAQRHFCFFEEWDGGLPVILHCGWPGWTIIFYSTAPRPFQTTQSQPPSHSE